MGETISKRAITALTAALLGFSAIGPDLAWADGDGAVKTSEAASVASLAALNLAQTCYIEGDFLEAADKARPLGADGLALAARALMAEATLAAAPAQRRALVVQAEKAARAAIDAKNDHAQAHGLAALALGYRSRELPAMEVYDRGWVGESKDMIDRALKIAPENAYLHAVAGGWHLDVMNRAGRAFGGLLFGADEVEGVVHFNTALELDPYNPVIAYQYALSVLALSPNTYRSRAEGLLERALETPPRDAFEAGMQRQAQRLKAALEAGDRSALKKAVRNLQGYPPKEA